MKFVSRAQWGARPRGATTSTHPIGAVAGVTFHWEGPHMGEFGHSACASKVRGIEAYHRDKKQWADIAYNALVCSHGHVFEGRGVDVRSAANGNTAANAHWYAVCYIGGQGDPFTDDAKAGFLDAVAWLRTSGGAGMKVNGHRDHKATECPGDTIHTWAHTHAFGTIPGQQEDDDMQLGDDIALWDPTGDKSGKTTVGKTLNQTRGFAEGAYERSTLAVRAVTELRREVAELKALIEALAAK